MSNFNYWIFPVFLPNGGCRHRCAFCDQFAVTGEAASLPEIRELEALFEKVRFEGKRANDTSLTRQIAFYGGNFSGLSRRIQERYLEWASEKVSRGFIHSIRFSTRPDALDDDEIAFLKHYPVRTIEIGVQSLDDGVLEMAKRGHTAAESREAVARIVSHGWEAGVQLMPGLPGEIREDFLRGVEEVASWGIRFARLYPAVVLKGTRLAEMYAGQSYTPLTLEEAVAWCAASRDVFESEGVEVIRVGLPASKRLRESVIAGPYHPAFGFLVQSYRFYRQLDETMNACSPAVNETVEIVIAPRNLPLLLGDRKEAWKHLLARWPGREMTYRLDPTVAADQIRVWTVPSSLPS